ncbi:hypothetical protein [Kribbella sp. C-35]|uniref:hypothetical protein n=1 Tax=Kribbella sp. C-35 TaxID=2789276 RepID=UPI00397ABCDF
MTENTPGEATVSSLAPLPIGPLGSARSVSAGEDAMSGCARELAAAENVLAAARVGIGHWAEHVQARTELLAGIKPKVSAIWKGTRLAGPADLQRYDDDAKVLATLSGVCSAVTATSSELSVCKRRAQVVGDALATGRAAMGDWRSHQAAMAAHKAGDFDAAHAQTLWVAAWTAAPKNINAFKAADARLSTTPPCQT